MVLSRYLFRRVFSYSRMATKMRRALRRSDQSIRFHQVNSILIKTQIYGWVNLNRLGMRSNQK